MRVELQSETEDGGYDDEDEVEEVMSRAARWEFGAHRKGCGIAHSDVGFVGDLETVIPSVAEQGPTQLMTHKIQGGGFANWLVICGWLNFKTN